MLAHERLLQCTIWSEICSKFVCAGTLTSGMLVPTCSISRQIWRCAVLVITVHIPECSSSTLKVHISSRTYTSVYHMQQNLLKTRVPKH